MSAAGPSISATLDTNLIVSGAITPGGIPNQVLRARQRDEFTMVSSPDLTAEVAGVLERPRVLDRYKPDPADVTRILEGLIAVEVRPLPLDALPVHCRDAKDDPILACALGGGADYIVTGDDDLLVLDGHPALGSLRIVRPREFLILVQPGMQ